MCMRMWRSVADVMTHAADHQHAAATLPDVRPVPWRVQLARACTAPGPAGCPPNAGVPLLVPCLVPAPFSFQDVSLVGADPVLWYSFAVTHLPRLEVRGGWLGARGSAPS